MVREPKFSIIVNGTDKTETIYKSLLSISITDNANEDADELEINIAGNYSRPAYGDEIKVYLGYSDLTFMGLYKVESTTKTFTQLTIKATAIDYGDELKVKKSTNWEKLSIKDIVSQIASKNKLAVKCDCGDVYFVSKAQTRESDLHFLNRLAKENNAIFNIKNNTIYFVKKMKEKSKNEELPNYTIDVDFCSDISIEHGQTSSYECCEVCWHDTKENKTLISYYPQKKEPILKIKGSYKNESQAIQKAKSSFDRAKQGTIKGSLTTEGKVVFAGGTLELLNNIDDSNEKYQITTVTHSLDKQNGWSTAIEFEK